jgi:CheY-like chemotaxis protein
MREKEIFLLAPGNHSDHPAVLARKPGFILVVEDDIPTLRLERVILEEEGYGVEVVGNGEEALKVIAEQQPDLVLLDIGLPGMDGFTICQRIRELSRVPIIMVTGRDCLDDKVRGMEAGADDYVTKPFLTHELATRVKVLLRRSGFTNQEDSPLEPVGQDSLWPAESDESYEEKPAEPPPQPVDRGVYEGTVRLVVITPGPVRNLISFVSELRQNPQFRLLRLVASQDKEGSMDIWLGLREPLPLETVLMGMPGVAEVTAPADVSPEEKERLLRVALHE